MKERPILFNGPMVRAILEGRKTQTRRVMKPQIDLSEWPLKPGTLEKEKEWRYMPRVADWHHIEENMWGLFNKGDRPSAVPYTGVKCPFGQPGARLWVRETHYFHSDESISFRADKVDGVLWSSPQADGLERELDIPKWRPSIHMPRWASRITLEVVSVRVERVQEISEYDATSEGITPAPGCYDTFLDDAGKSISAENKFRLLWDSINAKRGLGWDANPWVWVIEFKMMDRPL